MSLALSDERSRWQAVLASFKRKIGPMKWYRLTFPTMLSYLTSRCPSSSDVETAQQDVLDIATQLTRELIADWNRTTITCRLPAEVLAACFSFLSLDDLLSATHVSRRWRATAIYCPELWNSLVFASPLMNFDVVRMVVERSGRLPLDFEFLGGGATDDLVDYLGRQMHRIRRLEWNARRAEFLLQPAPLLESLICRTLSPIPEDALGGAPGRLRTLILCPLTLPSRCPALGSVTFLCADVSFRQHDLGSLANLFSVCRMLEHLELDGLADVHYPHLSSGTPTRLKSLTLRSTGTYACDVMVYVHAWGAANPSLAHVLLHMEVIPANASPMFAGAETLVVTQYTGRGSPSIATTRADGRKFTLVRRRGWSAKVNYDVLSATLADIIRPHAALFGALRVLRAPVTVLDALFSPAPAPTLVELRTLTVVVQMWVPQDQSVIDRIVYGDPDPVFPASLFVCLKTLGQSPLERIEVVVATTGGHALADEQVRDVLTTLGGALPPRDGLEIVDVSLWGLREGITKDALPHVLGYRIEIGGEGGSR